MKTTTHVGKAVLKTLADANRDAHRRHARSISSEPLLNGIACPKCGSELLDSRPDVVLPSLPPQKNIYCTGCGYRGYRTV
jgi:hypothetical protein